MHFLMCVKLPRQKVRHFKKVFTQLTQFKSIPIIVENSKNKFTKSNFNPRDFSLSSNEKTLIPRNNFPVNSNGKKKESQDNKHVQSFLRKLVWSHQMLPQFL